MSISYNRTELWERKINEDVVKSGKMTTFFRPSERICKLVDDKKCFFLGEEIRVLVVDCPGYSKRRAVLYDKEDLTSGSDNSVFVEVLPEFSKVSRRAEIVRLDVFNIEDLKENHFLGSPNIKDKNDLLCFMSLVYDLPKDAFDKFTRIEIKYLD
jgi:hypothetical protein